MGFGCEVCPAIFSSSLPPSVNNRMLPAHLAHNVALLFCEEDPALRRSKCLMCIPMCTVCIPGVPQSVVHCEISVYEKYSTCNALHSGQHGRVGSVQCVIGFRRVLLAFNIFLVNSLVIGIPSNVAFTHPQSFLVVLHLFLIKSRRVATKDTILSN